MNLKKEKEKKFLFKRIIIEDKKLGEDLTNN
jgi:hypothetical protein